MKRQIRFVIVCYTFQLSNNCIEIFFNTSYHNFKQFVVIGGGFSYVTTTFRIRRSIVYIFSFETFLPLKKLPEDYYA